jgi:hypothetical protein
MVETDALSGNEEGMCVTRVIVVQLVLLPTHISPQILLPSLTTFAPSQTPFIRPPTNRHNRFISQRLMLSSAFQSASSFQSLTMEDWHHPSYPIPHPCSPAMLPVLSPPFALLISPLHILLPRELLALIVSGYVSSFCFGSRCCANVNDLLQGYQPFRFITHSSSDRPNEERRGLFFNVTLHATAYVTRSTGCDRPLH